MRNAADPDVLAKTQGLIEYIREFVRSRHSPVRNYARYESATWLTEIPGPADWPVPRSGEVLFSVDYLPLRPHPQPPQVLHGWLDGDAITQPDRGDPQLADEGPAYSLMSGDVDPMTVRRSEALDVLRAYQEWLPEWQTWARDELAAHPYRQLYRKLSQMSRRVAQADDIYEVVLGVALLTRDAPQPRHLSRHVVTRRVSIVIDRATARIDVMLASDASVRFEDRDFLAEDDGYSGERAEQVRGELADQDLHPLSEEVWHTLQRWAELAFDEAVRCDSGWDRPEFTDGTLALTLAPAIILRQRDTNALAEYYDRIAASLNGPNACAPLGLAQLVASLERKERLAWNGDSVEDKRTAADSAIEPLFPLPANDSQRDVLARMYSDTAVVVQGPPGTGKTHTIANLISAFLSQGHRVLVTSQKDQALRELRDKLPEQVRDLCVMLTGVQRDGLDEFERSITALSDYMSSTSQAAVEHDILEFTSQRDTLLSREAQLRTAILELREAEWTEHAEVAPGYGGTLAAITSRVATFAPRYDWLPPLPVRESGGSALSDRPPLNTAEMLELHTLLGQQTPARRARHSQRLPELDAIPDAETFERLVQATQQARDLATRSTEIVRLLARLGDIALAELSGHVEAAATAAHRMRQPEHITEWDVKDWRIRALRDRFGKRNVTMWQNIGAGAERAREAQQLLESLGQRRVSVPDMTYDQMAALIRAGTQLHTYLAQGGRLRRHFLVSQAQRNAQPLLDSCRVDGQPPADANDVDALLARLRAGIEVGSLVELWKPAGFTVVQGMEMSVVLSHFVDLYAQLAEVDAIARAHDAVDTLLSRHGIRLTILATPEGWDTVCMNIPAAISLGRAQKSQIALSQLTQRLPAAAASDPPELGQLRRAVEAKDPDGYRRALSGLDAARAEQRDQRRCDELLARLHEQHPGFADILARTAPETGWADRLHSLPEAWSWRIAKAFCENVRDPGRDRKLQHELDETQSQITRATVRLVAAHAWLHCLQRITPEQQMALQSYRSAIGSLGKGTGRYADRHRSSARSAMRVAQSAVPAWIMPLQKVIETIPAIPDAFDVVIVDEASQASLEAVFLLWLAPRVIAVGDDKQCAPFYAAEEHQKHYDRLRAYLPDLAEHERHAFRPDSNLYEILSQRFPDVVRLSEHFRCMPEIIGWSSRQFYDDRLIPLRQFGADRLNPLHVVHVSGGYVQGRRENIRNEPEAKQLVEKLQELLEDPHYNSPPKTFGVIALQGTGQARLIENMIIDSIDPTVIERHDIRVGAPPDFQGAERDVIMLSMVIAEPYRSLTRREEQRRFNVAASRARDQMWLFTSVKRDRLSRDDLRFSLLDYMEDPPSYLGESRAAEEVSTYELQDPFDSLFEQRVFRKIRQRGYHVMPQFPVGKRRIDLVVSGDNGRLAVECDGRIAHTTPDQIRKDMNRERELRRAGWRFWRVRESEFTFDADRALEPLWDELARLGIHPGVEEMIVGTESSSWSPADLSNEEDEMIEDKYPIGDQSDG
jgi:very-short-patch-repair endonuclease